MSRHITTSDGQRLPIMRETPLEDGTVDVFVLSPGGAQTVNVPVGRIEEDGPTN